MRSIFDMEAGLLVITDLPIFHDELLLERFDQLVQKKPATASIPLPGANPTKTRTGFAG
jgi:hypothetical protein